MIQGKSERLQNLVNSFVEKRSSVSAIIIASEEGLPIVSKIDPNSKEVEFFLSAVVSSLSSTFSNIINTLKMKPAEDVNIDLKTGAMVIHNLKENVSVGVIIRSSEDFEDSSKSILQDLSEQIEGILFS